MKISYLVSILLTFHGILFCQNNRIKTPYENYKYNSGIEIMNFIYPESFEFQKNSLPDTVKFQIPSNQFVEELEESIFKEPGNIKYYFSSFIENEIVNFKAIRERQLKYEKINIIDIENDGNLEVFYNSHSQWGGGKSFILYWEKEANIYKLKNAFWGNFGKIGVNQYNEISFIVLIDSNGLSTTQEIHEVTIPSCKINKTIKYRGFLSIPIKTKKSLAPKNITINSQTELRVWPENINTGFFSAILQDRNNGNVEAILQENFNGSAYAQFTDSDNKKWYLVTIQINQIPIWHTFGKNITTDDYIVGWLDEESILFDE